MSASRKIVLFLIPGMAIAATLAWWIHAYSAPAEAKSVLNISYKEKGRSNELNMLDLYLPEGKGPFPVVVFVHGGGWSFGDKSMVGAKARRFPSEGFILVSINYRLSPRVMHPTHAEDVAQAIVWIEKHIAEYGGDPKQIYLMGHSAGAHLAALLATDEKYLESLGSNLQSISGVILLDGAGYDIPARDEEWFIQRIYDRAFGKNPDVLKDASPIHHVEPGKGIPSFLIIYAGDRIAAKIQSSRLANALEDAGVKVTLKHAPDKNHLTLNRELGFPRDEPTSWILSFLESGVGIGG